MVESFASWFEDDGAPRCQVHLRRAATRTCARCGSFGCEGCVADEGLCERCTDVRTEARVPELTQSIAWKLLLAPGFGALSAGLLLTRHAEVPASFVIWVVPAACAIALVMTRRAGFGWLGVFTSLAVLGYQAWGAVDEGAWVRLSDVGMLAVAPLAAVFGCLSLGRARARARLIVR